MQNWQRTRVFVCICTVVLILASTLCLLWAAQQLGGNYGNAIWYDTLLPFEEWVIFMGIDSIALFYILRNAEHALQLTAEVALRMEYVKRLEALQEERGRAL